MPPITGGLERITLYETDNGMPPEIWWIGKKFLFRQTYDVAGLEGRDDS